MIVSADMCCDDRFRAIEATFYGVLRSAVLPRYAVVCTDIHKRRSAAVVQVCFDSMCVAADGTIILLASSTSDGDIITEMRREFFKIHTEINESTGGLCPLTRTSPMDIIHISLGRVLPHLLDEDGYSKLARFVHSYNTLPISEKLTTSFSLSRDVVLMQSKERFMMSPQRACRPVVSYARSALERSLGDLANLKPKLLTMHVLPFLPPHDVLALAAVSRVWYALQNDLVHWRERVMRDHVGDDKRARFTFTLSWKVTTFFPNGIKTGRKTAYPGLAFDPRNHVRPTSKTRWYTFRGGSGAIDLRGIPCKEDVPRCHKLSLDEFIHRFESPNRPVVITGMMDDWPAMKKWSSMEVLLENYGEQYLKTNVTNHKDQKIFMRLRDFASYCADFDKEKPIYLFDKKFAERAPGMGSDYTVPCYFQEDLFEKMEDDDRPDWHWFLMGPGGSGSPFHTDPHRSSAWNAVTCGAKRVSFYPPDQIPPGVDEDLIDSDVYPSEDTIEWLTETFPDLSPRSAPLECIVRAGEMLFIPSGWWHQVVNLETPTIAVTQNYCSSRTLPMVVGDLKERGPKSLRKDFKAALKGTPYQNVFD
eukprot:PhM_4_TR16539/c0_g1_i1/m.53249